MVNSTRVVSTLVGEREGEKDQHRARRIKNNLKSQIGVRQQETCSAPLAFVLFVTLWADESRTTRGGSPDTDSWLTGSEAVVNVCLRRYTNIFQILGFFFSRQLLEQVLWGSKSPLYCDPLFYCLQGSPLKSHLLSIQKVSRENASRVSGSISLQLIFKSTPSNTRKKKNKPKNHTHITIAHQVFSGHLKRSLRNSLIPQCCYMMCLFCLFKRSRRLLFQTFKFCICQFWLHMIICLTITISILLAVVSRMKMYFLTQHIR